MFLIITSNTKTDSYEQISLNKKRDVIITGISRKNYIHRIHTSTQINKIISLPFRSFWYKKLINQKTINKINSENSPIVILPECLSESFDINFLKFIRKVIPGVKIIFSFSNPAFSLKRNTINFIENNYNLVITFCYGDHKKYGWTYYSGCYSENNSVYENNTELDSDVLFVGVNKNRIDEINSVYLKLTSMGLNCQFYVTEVPKEKMLVNSGIVYNKPISYPAVLKKCVKTKCILDIIQKGQTGCSLRVMESIVYKKKLISNNSRLKEERYYSDKQMLYYEKLDDISISFFTEENIPYVSATLIDPYSRLEFIKNTLFENERLHK